MALHKTSLFRLLTAVSSTSSPLQFCLGDIARYKRVAFLSNVLKTWQSYDDRPRKLCLSVLKKVIAISAVALIYSESSMIPSQYTTFHYSCTVVHLKLLLFSFEWNPIAGIHAVIVFTIPMYLSRNFKSFTISRRYTLPKRAPFNFHSSESGGLNDINPNGITSKQKVPG